MKKIIVTLLLFFCSTFFSAAQSSERLSDLMETDKISKGQAAYLTATLMNLVEESAGNQDAFAVLQEHKLFSAKDNPDDAITIGHISLLYMKACGIKGGILYTITKNRRYAFRELKARGILPNQVTSTMLLSGLDALNLLNDCISKSEGAQ